MCITGISGTKVPDSIPSGSTSYFVIYAIFCRVAGFIPFDGDFVRRRTGNTCQFYFAWNRQDSNCFSGRIVRAPFFAVFIVGSDSVIILFAGF